MKTRKPLPRISARREAQLKAEGKPLPGSTIAKRGGRPIPKKNPTRRSKRQARNKAYYNSAEWRAKKKAVHERDGFRCVELLTWTERWPGLDVPVTVTDRCPNRGEIVNGKQTARGLVCEEKSYGHRGIPGRIDTCVTRCKDCDRRLTPLERANHANGFSGRGEDGA